MSGVTASRKKIMDQLDKVGLADRHSGKVKTFIQGMKQRLGIAVALVHDPKLIILDEPVNGLDPQGIADMRVLIKSLSRDQGKTVIISSHLLYEIEQVATRMLIIHKGRKVAEGVVAEMLDPSHTIVLTETTNNEKASTAMRTLQWMDKVTQSGRYIRCEMDRKRIPELVSFLSGIQVDILSIQPRHSLEDYFLNITNPVADVELAAN
jgi:ABC-type multidrug transport system ATPase subunit